MHRSPTSDGRRGVGRSSSSKTGCLDGRGHPLAVRGPRRATVAGSATRRAAAARDHRHPTHILVGIACHFTAGRGLADLRSCPDTTLATAGRSKPCTGFFAQRETQMPASNLPSCEYTATCLVD
eukprot:366222-Chlamydomonas_euryale.AAC.7